MILITVYVAGEMAGYVFNVCAQIEAVAIDIYVHDPLRHLSPKKACFVQDDDLHSLRNPHSRLHLVRR